MKTESKEYWVNDSIICALKDKHYSAVCMEAWTSPTLSRGNKITITFEVPEKKVEISESEFDRMINEWDSQQETRSLASFMWFKLFGNGKWSND